MKPTVGGWGKGGGVETNSWREDESCVKINKLRRAPTNISPSVCMNITKVNIVKKNKKYDFLGVLVTGNSF